MPLKEYVRQRASVDVQGEKSSILFPQQEYGGFNAYCMKRRRTQVSPRQRFFVSRRLLEYDEKKKSLHCFHVKKFRISDTDM